MEYEGRTHYCPQCPGTEPGEPFRFAPSLAMTKEAFVEKYIEPIQLFAPEAPNVTESPKAPEIAFSEYIRMVQIFFNQKGFDQFTKLTEKLAKQYNTNNVTDTVMEALKDANSKNRSDL